MLPGVWPVWPQHAASLGSSPGVRAARARGLPGGGAVRECAALDSERQPVHLGARQSACPGWGPETSPASMTVNFQDSFGADHPRCPLLASPLPHWTWAPGGQGRGWEAASSCWGNRAAGEVLSARRPFPRWQLRPAGHLSQLSARCQRWTWAGARAPWDPVGFESRRRQ